MSPQRQAYTLEKIRKKVGKKEKEKKKGGERKMTEKKYSSLLFVTHTWTHTPFF
jgi:hypothetical protein